MKKKNKSLCFHFSRSVEFYVLSLTKILPRMEELYKKSEDLYKKGKIEEYQKVRTEAFELDLKWSKTFFKYTDHTKHLSMKAEKTHMTRPQKYHEAIWLNGAIATQFKYYEIIDRNNKSLENAIDSVFTDTKSLSNLANK